MSALLDAIIRGAIGQRKVVLIAALALVAAGLWSAQAIHLDALPNFTPPIVEVQAEAPGLGTAQVEQLVTTPLEQALLGIPDVVRARSTSSPGLAVVQLTFEDDVDIFRARQLTGERIADARDRLPASTPRPRLAPITAPVGSLVKFAYTSIANDQASMRALWQFAAWKVRPRLQALQGIARVTVLGGAAARVEVQADSAKLLARGVDLAALRDALADAQGLTPIGFTTTGSQRQPIRAAGFWSWTQLDGIADTVIASREGLPIRVRDVAQVTVADAPAVGSALYDGKPAIAVQVEKLPWADTLQLDRDVAHALAALDRELPAGTARTPPTFRQAAFIRTSLGALASAMSIGAVLVTLILVAFLRSPRLAAVSLSALPLSSLAAVAVLHARGVTMNGMILGGLAVAVGEVVDDAIVDVENIWRRLRENAQLPEPRSAWEVIRLAAIEVRGSVVYASLIVVTVLTPVIALRGLAGRIFSPLAETYALAVAASLLVALTVTPALSAFLLPRIATSHAHETRLAGAIKRGYERILARAATRPGSVVLGSAVLGALALALLPLLRGDFLPEFREGVLIADVSAWPGTSLEEATRLAGRLDGTLRRNAGVQHTLVRVGRASLDEDAAPVHRIEMDLVLPAASDPEQDSARVLEQLDALPGIQFSVEGFLGERINELLSGDRAPIVIKLFGPELEALRRSAAQLVSGLSGLEGVQRVRLANPADVPTQDLRIDDARLGIAGIRRADIVTAAATISAGLEVAQLSAPGGFAIPVVIASPRSGRLADVPIFTASSVPLPLSSVAAIEERSEPAVIEHENGLRLVTLLAEADEGNLSAAAADIERLLARAQLPLGCSWQLAGQAAERGKAGIRLFTITCAVLVAVFVFLWLAFRSAVDALVVLAGLPLGIVGGVLAALLLPGGLSMPALVGFVALTGVISRNGVMLVVHKNQLLAQQPGAAVERIVQQAARERLLPILMTAMTAFFGLVPLAASLGTAGSELEAPMAFIVCGGLISSTLLNLIAVPCFYLWSERRSTRSRRTP